MSQTTTTTTTTTSPAKTHTIRSIIPSPRIAIVDLTPNNIGTLRKLNSILFPVSYSDKFYHEVLEDYLSDFCKLIYYNDLPVGAVCCRIEPDPKLKSNTVIPVDYSSSNETNGTSTQTKLYIMTLGVLAPYRQQGLATKLLDQVISAAQKTHLSAQSTSNVNVQVPTMNTATTTSTSTMTTTTTTNETKKSHQKGKKSTVSSKPIESVTSSVNNSNNKSNQSQELIGDQKKIKVEIPSISSAYVHVQFGNDDAKEFYIKRGFQVQGEIQDYYRKIQPRGAWILGNQVLIPN